MSSAAKIKVDYYNQFKPAAGEKTFKEIFNERMIALSSNLPVEVTKNDNISVTNDKSFTERTFRADEIIDTVENIKKLPGYAKLHEAAKQIDACVSFATQDVSFGRNLDILDLRIFNTVKMKNFTLNIKSGENDSYKKSSHKMHFKAKSLVNS